MADRRFSEVDLRTMLERASAYRPDIVVGRWTIVTRHRQQPWEVIVEPDHDTKVLVVVTAYPIIRSRVNEMKECYLEVTYRHGRPLAAYLYLPRGPRDRSQRATKAAAGLIIDFTRSGRPIGIEITAPNKATAAVVNRVLKDLGFPPITRADLAPLRAA